MTAEVYKCGGFQSGGRIKIIITKRAMTLPFPTLIACFCVWSTIYFLHSESRFFPKRNTPVDFNLIDTVIPAAPKKRPFCNAFTGCGRKRSNLPALNPQGEEIENSINSLLELSAEPAVEDLSRQIMSQAKLWEAIQEANLEMRRRKQQASLENTDDDPGIPAKSATANCALPPCYI